MKKRIWAILVAMMLSLVTLSTCFAAENTTDSSEEEIMSFETLQGLFPNISLREDGYVNGYNQGMSPASEQNWEQIFSEPVESYSADYNGGICTLNIYSNGAYGTCGYEIVDEINPLGEGYENQGGTKYRSYYTMMGPQGFSYTYNVSGSNYSTISNLSSVSVQWGIGNSYFAAGTSRYVRASQTSSAAAQVYGEAEYYHMGYFNGTFRLTTNVSYGNITVSCIAY